MTRLIESADPALRIGEFTLAPGTLACLVAPNGRGKTRLLLQIMGRIDAPPGQIVVLGHPPGARANRGRIALLADNARAPGHATRREAVAWALALREPGLARRALRDTTATALSRLGVGAADAERATETASGGEERITTLAMALAGSAPLILLDEPDNTLDAAHAQALDAALRIRTGEGAAILATSARHALAGAQALAFEAA